MIRASIDIQKLLLDAAVSLDIPDFLYEDATLKYQDVAAHLSESDSPLAVYSPDIYPQGSFRLGTVVRPVNRLQDYDIDLVCRLLIEKELITQETLKRIVGQRLGQRQDLAQILKASRRCWTLDFPKQFHMDVLPCIPNKERAPSGILLSDRDLRLWQYSNPVAYADWFYNRMRTILEQLRAAFAAKIQAQIDDVPEWQVKTPLQRAIQLLKRHRDDYFSTNSDRKPSSIIITTLAALSYSGHSNLQEALIALLREMPRFVERRGDQWWIVNPVDDRENFADKWNEDPARSTAFQDWIQKARNDFADLHLRPEKVVAILTPKGGDEILAKAIGISTPIASSSAILAPIVPSLADYRHLQSPLWPERLNYKVNVVGSVHKNRSAKKLWMLTDNPIPKTVWLRFSARTNTPPPYEIHWQVVNTVRKRQSRGSFEANFTTRMKPQTAYAGNRLLLPARTGSKPL